jgi:biotin carboxylase
MKKLAILGASYLQVPLIIKAKEMGIVTHVFAWEEGAVGKKLADFFYPISILEKELIFKKCEEIGVSGITTIATDIAMITVNFVASKMNLVGNSIDATLVSTDKFEMRRSLSRNGIPCPRFSFFEENNFKNLELFEFPLIVKPTDRSGSRGVTKVSSIEETNEAILKALADSINKRVIVEEFVDGQREFSVECIAFNGRFYPLAVTDKITTGSPHFCELEHHQPAKISDELKERIFDLTLKTLKALGLENGASHTEVILDKNNDLSIVEVAGRMGGDFIGSHLVELSTGFDFLRATIDVALNQFNYVNYLKLPLNPYSGVYYLTPKPGVIKEIINFQSSFDSVVYCEALLKKGDLVSGLIDGSDKRSGVVIYSSVNYNPIVNRNDVLKFETE